jgi:hypothetical protein
LARLSVRETLGQDSWVPLAVFVDELREGSFGEGQNIAGRVGTLEG